MNRVVGVSFKQNSKIYFFNDNALKINDGDMVITETDRGLQLGCVVASDIMNKEVDDKMKKIVRVATPKDVMIFEKNKVDAFKALSKAKEISEDEADDLEKAVQKLTDKFITEVDKAVDTKTKEVLTV